MGKLWRQQLPLALVWEGDFAVHASMYGKVQAGPTPTPDAHERRRRKELVVLPELGCLATYIGCAPRVSICLC